MPLELSKTDSGNFTEEKPSPTVPKVISVVLTYNGMRWVKDCLSSLMQTKYANHEVIVVDNNSTDETVSFVREKYPEVEIISCKKNMGTSRGWNIGIKIALKRNADYIAVLNQDIRVHENWLRSLIKVGESAEDVGILGPVQFDYKGESFDPFFKGNVCKGTTFIKDFGQSSLNDYYLTRFMIFACAVIKRQVFEKIGYLEELYFMYAEDHDYCRKAFYSGFKIALVPNSRVLHNHSHVNKEFQSLKSLRLAKRNGLIYFFTDPPKSLFYNFKNVFHWINWNEYFDDVPLKQRKRFMARTFIELVILLPLIIRKYSIDRKLIRTGDFRSNTSFS